MKQFTLIIASLYGLTSVILGAFGSHLFKKLLTPEKLVSFEVAVRYQMYHAIVLLIIGLYFTFNTPLEKWSTICIMLGTFLFAFTIYLLSFSEYWGINLRFLGPITPIGGAILMVGWLLLVIYFFKLKIHS